VAGHYLPLADNPGVAPESDQTDSLQSDQRTLGKPSIINLGAFQVFSRGNPWNGEGRLPFSGAPALLRPRGESRSRRLAAAALHRWPAAIGAT